MSKIDELIKKLCPNGVKYYELGELGKFYGGLTGKSKEDFKDGNAKFITYMNVYKNPSLDINVEDKVKIKENENQRTLEYGDIIFTGSSETPDECGISSVLTTNTKEKLYLNSFCFFFRFNDPTIMNPDFAKHLFRSSDLRYQIGKTASGVTRFNVSKKLMEKVKIAVPPLEVQYEIVRILNDFMLLSAELSAELKARQKQYEYYRNELTKSSDAKKIKFGDIAKIQRGASPRPISEFITNDENGVNWIKIGDVEANQKYITKCKEKITIDGSKKSRNVKKGDFILSNSMSFGRPYILAIDGCIHDGWLSISEFQEYYIPDFLYHLLSSNEIQNEFRKKASFGGAVQNLNADIVRNIELPLISLEKQKEIVKVLDKFESFTNDMTIGLPAEIEARQKQYNYYRDKLLSFKEIGSE